MSTSAILDSMAVQIDPGGEAVVPLQIRNDSDLVEAYHLEVVGLPAQWTVIEPATVSLYPGDVTTTRLLFKPPRSAAVPAGELPYGVRIVPSEHPEHTVVPEGVVQVLPFTETAAELTPRTSRGRLRGKHQVAVDNRGNVALSAVLHPSDPNDALKFSLRSEGVTVSPGRAAFTGLAVRPKRRVWTGQPVTHQFQVAVAPTESAPVVLNGTYLQEPVVPKWTVRALLVLLALAVALVALWFAVLRPTIRSAARDAVAPATKQAQAAAAEAKQAADGAAAQAGAARQQADGAKQAGATASGASKAAQARAEAEANAERTAPQPFSNRLQLTVGAGATKDATFTIPAKQTLKLSDLVLQNPQGDVGPLVIKRDNEVLWTVAMENYRDTDYHFISPIVFSAGDKVVMHVTCDQVGKAPAGSSSACRPAMYFGGDMLVPVKPAKKTP